MYIYVYIYISIYIYIYVYLYKYKYMFIYIKFVSSFQLFQQRSKNSKEIAEKNRQSKWFDKDCDWK